MIVTVFSAAEKARYARHFSLAEVGAAGQAKLHESSVLLVGAGGIGSPAALYLAAAGVGRIGVVDHDTVELSNLQRQILFSTDGCGQKKAACAQTRLLSLNPHIRVDAYEEQLTLKNAERLISTYDMVVDGSDNYATRYVVGDVTARLHKPLVAASVFQWSGQLSVFNHQNGPCFRCLYPTPPPDSLIPNCSEAGVVGVLPGILGTLAANEVIKLILAVGTSLSGALLTVDALTTEFKRYPIHKHAHCPACVDKKPLAVLHPEESALEITITEFQQCRSKVNVLDVREAWEREHSYIENSVHVPLGQLSAAPLPFALQDPIVVYCHAGLRSLRAVQLLKERGFVNVKSLAGGIEKFSL